MRHTLNGAKLVLETCDVLGTELSIVQSLQRKTATVQSVLDFEDPSRCPLAEAPQNPEPLCGVCSCNHKPLAVRDQT